MSQVLEQVIQEPVTHWGPGAEVEKLGSVGSNETMTVGGEDEVVVLLAAAAVVVVLVVVGTVVVV